jgi:hypothetical protein
MSVDGFGCGSEIPLYVTGNQDYLIQPLPEVHNDLSLLLFMLGILTNYHYFPSSADHLTFFAHWFYGSSNFQPNPSLIQAFFCCLPVIFFSM